MQISTLLQHTRRQLVRGGIVAVTGVAALSLGALHASAHVVQQFGPYAVAVGWQHEPTYVDQLNAVQVIIKDQAGNPVTSVQDGDLKAQVAIGSHNSDPLTLKPAFDPDTGRGTAGEYDASILPTAAGEYTFHITGKIGTTAVDQSFTSSDKTFESVKNPSDIQFPLKVPAGGDIATRLDRVDVRAQADAGSAHDAANRALLAGGVVGALGVVLGAAGLGMALARRRTKDS